jgi:putative transposase
MHYFGDVVAEADGTALLNKSTIGQIAHNNWLDIPNHFSFIELDDFVIMPNHIHGILYINKPDKISWELNKFGKQSQNLASVVRGFKASVKTYATTNSIEFDWQPRYHDHVIRNEKEYLNICRYITNNPGEWLLNGDNEDNLYKT